MSLFGGAGWYNLSHQAIWNSCFSTFLHWLRILLFPFLNSQVHSIHHTINLGWGSSCQYPRNTNVINRSSYRLIWHLFHHLQTTKQWEKKSFQKTYLVVLKCYDITLHVNRKLSYKFISVLFLYSDIKTKTDCYEFTYFKDQICFIVLSFK